ncbi:Vang-like protein 1, partial [Trichinella patagoniensis]
LNGHLLNTEVLFVNLPKRMSFADEVSSVHSERSGQSFQRDPYQSRNCQQRRKQMNRKVMSGRGACHGTPNSLLGPDKFEPSKRAYRNVFSFQIIPSHAAKLNFINDDNNTIPCVQIAAKVKEIEIKEAEKQKATPIERILLTRCAGKLSCPWSVGLLGHLVYCWGLVSCVIAMDVEDDGPEENWAENTTCLTGNTSERSFSYDDLRRFKQEPLARSAGGGMGGRRSAYWSARCSRLVSNICSSAVALLSAVSPIAMVSIPKAQLLFAWSTNDSSKANNDVFGGWQTSECGADCQGLLIGFVVKMSLLLLGVWALFWRRADASLPRLFVGRACLLAFVFLFLFAYWLFYVVRIVQKAEPSYTVIVSYALSLVDALLFVHYSALVAVELLPRLRPVCRVHVLRSPDGFSRSYLLGQLSVQRAAVQLLHWYYRDFPPYNPLLDRPLTSAKAKKSTGSQVGANPAPPPAGAFKIYDVDGRSEAVSLSDVNAKAIMAAAARKRDSAHNERFYEELEWERRVRKRKARLLTAVEEAFAHVQRFHDEKGPCSLMDSCEAAQSIFPALARALQKYLRVTRQQHRFSAESILDHLSNCLTYDMSAKAFLEQYFTNNDDFHQGIQTPAKWSIVCKQLVSMNISDGMIFQLRCHSPGFDTGVSLLCRVSRLPFLDLTEHSINPKNDAFVLKFNSETSTVAICCLTYVIVSTERDQVDDGGGCYGRKRGNSKRMAVDSAVRAEFEIPRRIANSLLVDGRWFEVDTDARHSLIVAKGDRLKILTASPEMNGHRLLCGSTDGRHYWRKMQIAVLLCNGTADPCNGRGRCVWSRMAPHTLPIVSCVCEKNYYGTFCTEYIGNAVFHGWATVVAAFLLMLLSTVLYSLKRSKIDKLLHQQRQKQKRLRAKSTRREMKYPIKNRPISRPQPITLRQPSKPKSKNLHRRKKSRL